VMSAAAVVNLYTFSGENCRLVVLTRGNLLDLLR
jgi:hypothetical protein